MEITARKTFSEKGKNAEDFYFSGDYTLKPMSGLKVRKLFIKKQLRTVCNEMLGQYNKYNDTMFGMYRTSM